MRQNTFNPLVVLELNRETELDDLAMLRAAGLRARVVKHVVGSYKGQTSPSYIIDVGGRGEHYGWTDDAALEQVMRLAAQAGQESVLFLNNKREAKLIYCDDFKSTNLGQFVAVSRDEALKQDGWTLDGNQFYICK